jgi:hypothetical protein
MQKLQSNINLVKEVKYKILTVIIDVLFSLVSVDRFILSI